MRIKIAILLICVFLFIPMLTSCGNTGQKKAEKPDQSQVGADKTMTNNTSGKSVTVAAAASLTDAMNELKTIYEKSHKGITIQPTYAGSGALQTQIEEGAPIDIFLSASNKQMNALEEKNLIDKESRIPLLKNEVVLITPKNEHVQIKDFRDLTNNKINKIAVADPNSVPVGQYSEEIFTKLGIWDQVKSKMVVSQDVRQSLDWVVHGEVDAGTVYKTDAYIEKDKVNIIASAPNGTHKPVQYPMAIVENSKDKKEVKDFYNFLKSEQALRVFEKYGFIIEK